MGMKDKMKVVVAGAGGMGSLVGSILHEGGQEVVLFDIDEEHIGAICQSGLRITGFGGNRTLGIAATSDAQSIKSADVVIFLCKSHGTVDAAGSVAHLVKEGAVCVSLQNGLGNEEEIGRVVGIDRVLGGLTTLAAVRLAPGFIRDFSRVPTYIGELDGRVGERVSKLAQEFTNSGLEAIAMDDIRGEIWKKLIGNMSFSATSGVTGLTSAEIMAYEPLREITLRAMSEAISIATSHGIAIERESVLAGMEVISKRGGTGDNMSSLRVDLENKRPSEVDSIYGVALAIARTNGISTPTLDSLAAAVKGMELSNTKVEDNQ